MSFRRRDEPSLEDNIASVIIDYIDEMGRKKGGLREAYAEAMSENKWRNKDFGALVGIIAEDWDRLERVHGKGGRLNENEILIKIIPDFIDGHYAFSLANSKETMRDIRDQRQREDIIDAADEWERLWAEPDDRDTRRRGRDDDDRRPSRGRESHRNYSARDDDDRDRGGRSSRIPMSDYNSSRRDSSPKSSGGAGTGTVWDGYLNEPDREEEVREAKPRRTEVEREREVVREFTPPVRHALPQPQGPDYSARCPHARFYVGEDEWVFGPYMKYPVLPGNEGEATRGVPTLFNTHEQLTFYVTDKHGVTRQEIISVTDDKRYLQQELMTEDKPVLGSAFVSESGRRLTSAGAEVVKQVEKRNTLLSNVISSVSMTTIKEAFAAGKVVALSSMQEVYRSLMIHMTNFPEQQLIPSLNLVRHPVTLFDYSEKTEDVLHRLFQAKNLSHLCEELILLRPSMDPKLFEFINARFSKLIHQSSAYQWQFHFKKFDFVQQWKELLLYIAKTESPEYYQAYVTRMNALVQVGQLRLDPAAVQSHLVDVIPEGQKANTVVFVEYVYSLGVPYTLDELGIGRQLEDQLQGVSIDELPNEDEPLTQVVRAIYANSDLNESERTITPITIVTKDNRLLNIWPHMCRQQKFILCERSIAG